MPFIDRTERRMLDYCAAAGIVFANWVCLCFERAFLSNVGQPSSCQWGVCVIWTRKRLASLLAQLNKLIDFLLWEICNRLWCYIVQTGKGRACHKGRQPARNYLKHPEQNQTGCDWKLKYILQSNRKWYIVIYATMSIVQHFVAAIKSQRWQVSGTSIKSGNRNTKLNWTRLLSRTKTKPQPNKAKWQAKAETQEETDWETDRESDRDTDRETERQAGREKDTQIDN